MDTVYLICAIVGGTFIVSQFVLTLFGIGADHGLDGGHSIDVHHGDAGTGDDHGSSWFFGMLSFRALSASLAFFGLTGLAAHRGGLEDGIAALLAVLAALAGLFIITWLLRQMTKLNVDGTVYIDRAVGSRGNVYLAIPGNKTGAGKVHVSLHHRTLEYKAITAGEALPNGTPIEVVGIIGPDTVEVTRVLSEKEVPAHG